ncbi:phenazine biosynthesis protein PhzF [Vitreoscilla filiformis]|jgi:PhzF family phenazine biosynthesis protein|uniref:Phenazine biosynthesis protein PhzF n=1 Tax=Vitreoscilla filiformis TaxID=63 RepID=A0A221KAR6_VITFI|nr:PhzF family phenazine biosynthesis protein [Vitreoscilla filiformis]ASM76096.1 phenazine biosynthesis protein PhzF [Vitreoscilla filiformis]
MSTHRFTQLDVFSADALRGNPLAVVHSADDLSEADMAAFARWTNLSETTFLLRPTDPAADYRVRIFTPHTEFPFAGHPTLGSCRAWLDAGGVPQREGVVVQECGAGLVSIRRDGARLAFAAPPCTRTGPLEPDVLAQIGRALRLAPSDIVAHQWVDNGPGWCAIRLASAAQVLALQPDWAALAGLKLGVIGPHEPGAAAQFEVRALIGSGGGFEDPVTGSLNASLAQWLIGPGVAPARYVAAQGHALGRAGRVHVERDAQNTFWIGGDVTPCVHGTLTL